MAADAGADRDRPVELTRPDQPLPRRDGPAAPPAGEAAPPAVPPQAEPPAETIAGPADAAAAAGPAPEPPDDQPTEPSLPPPPSASPAPVEPPPAGPAGPGGPGGPAPAAPLAPAAPAQRAPGPTWHRLHLPIGAFLIAYGVTVLLSAALTWGDRRAELEDYFSSGVAGPALIAVKAAQALLVLIALAAVLRRRDVWLVPPLAGWMAGFAMFAVLDVFGGDVVGLLEHCAYLAAFIALLFLAYGLSAKVQAARAPSGAGQGPGGSGLTRTQEFALSAINRLQRDRAAASGPAPASGPAAGPAPSSPPAPPRP